jgi:hypothetical protein
MSPTRRTVLATTATATSLTAGCLASTVTQDDPEPPEDRELTSVTTTVPDDARFSVDATILQPVIDPERTAEFELRVTWQGEDTVEYRFGSSIPFGEPKYSEDPAGLIILSNPQPRRNDRTWLPKTDNEDGYVSNSDAMGTRELAPGEDAAGTWKVWGDPSEVSHIEPGTYRFEEKTTPVRGGRTLTWEFTTTIEER